MTDVAIAAVCHEANRAYCLTLGDGSQPLWDAAPAWQRESAIEGVKAIRGGMVTNPGDSHASWLKHKAADGWVYGEVKDPAAKRHPCMVPFEELPVAQRAKDHLFLAITQALLEVPDE